MTPAGHEAGPNPFVLSGTLTKSNKSQQARKN